MRWMQRKSRSRRLSLFLLGFFAAYLGLCFYVADSIVSPKRRPAFLPKQFVTWEPAPGVPAWASPSVPQGKAKNLFIFSHGIKANRAFFASTAEELQKRGYDVVLLPMPGHDGSPEKTVGFGTSEAKLIKQTIDAVKADHIVLVGCSMGGAGTWMASDHPRVDGIATESAYGHLEPITHIWFNRALPFGDILFRPVMWIASARLHLNPSDINPVDTAAKWDHHKPALVMHAAGDQLIPIEQGEELARVSGAEFWRIPLVAHSDGQEVGKEYVDRVENVMLKVLHKKEKVIDGKPQRLGS